MRSPEGPSSHSAGAGTSAYENFLGKLIADRDDWSFVVKAHDFLESVICSLLPLHLRKPELQEVLAEAVEMSARIASSAGRTQQREFLERS